MLCGIGKANGGTLSTNNDGSITSSVQANTDARIQYCNLYWKWKHLVQ